MPEAARRGGSGRKLHDPRGRFDTRVKISDISRCCILVSCRTRLSAMRCSLRAMRDRVSNQLRVELGQPRLPLAVEDQECVDHFAGRALGKIMFGLLRGMESDVRTLLVFGQFGRWSRHGGA